VKEIDCVKLIVRTTFWRESGKSSTVLKTLKMYEKGSRFEKKPLIFCRSLEADLIINSGYYTSL